MIEVRHARSGNPLASIGWMLTAAAALVAIGMIAIHSVSALDTVDPLRRLSRQAAYAGLALVVAAVTSGIGHRRLLAMANVFFVCILALLALLFVPGLSTERGRWFDLSIVNFQPSEAAKIVMVLYLTRFARERGASLATFRQGFLPSMVRVGVLAALVIAEPDLGQGLFLLTLSSVILLINGLRIVHLAPLVAAGGAAVAVMANNFGYVRDRLDAYRSSLGGEMDLTSQVGQGLVALASGGGKGLGVGAGRAHLGYVPEIHNDFVMVAVGEQTGLIGVSLVVILFGLIVWHGLRIAYGAVDRQSYSIAYAVTLMLGLQAAVNFAVVTASAPAKGMSLPFVSYGGSALMMTGAAMGLLHSVARESHRAGLSSRSYFVASVEAKAAESQRSHDEAEAREPRSVRDLDASVRRARRAA